MDQSLIPLLTIFLTGKYVTKTVLEVVLEKLRWSLGSMWFTQAGRGWWWWSAFVCIKGKC